MLETAKERPYIYDGKEVRLTGRIAKKPVFDRRNRNSVIGEMTIVEITPKIGSMISSDPNLMQWVDPRTLYYVILEEAKIEDIDSIIESNKVLDEEDD